MSRQSELAALGRVADTGALSNRNLIINGAMQVAQRGTSSTSNGIQAVDRFGCAYGTGSITQSQQSLTSSDDPYEKGFRSSFRATVTTTSSSATSFIQLEQKIEAQDIAQSGWEYTNPNSYLTFSFWAKSSLAGTYYAQFRTLDGTSYYYNKSFTLAANTWKKLTVTVSGNSNLTINNDNGEGFRVLVIPDYGTDYSGHAEAVEDAWYARSQTSGYTPSYTQDWQNTSGATFELTGVQLEVGDTATEFEHRSYGDEMARCMRFYQEVDRGSGIVVNSTEAYINIPYITTMRAVPSFGVTGGLAVNDAGVNTTQSTGHIIAYNPNTSGSFTQMNNFSGLTQYRPALMRGHAGTFVTLDAEL